MRMVGDFVANLTMRGLSAATIKRRRWTLTAFTAQIAPRGFDQATTADVERFLSDRPTAATRRALLGDLRAFYRWANSRGLLDVDPTAPIETPKVPKRLPSPLTRDELQRAYDAADFRMRCIIALGAGAGLRVSEIAALTSDDLDFVHRSIMIRNGKGGVDRVVPMSGFLADLLSHCGPDTVPFKSGDSVSNAVREHFKRLGIKHRPHDLRHTFATELARVSGGNMMLVQQLLGHASLNTTQRYTAALPVGLEVVDALYAEEAA